MRNSYSWDLKLKFSTSLLSILAFKNESMCQSQSQIRIKSQALSQIFQISIPFPVTGNSWNSNPGNIRNSDYYNKCLILVWIFNVSYNPRFLKNKSRSLFSQPMCWPLASSDNFIFILDLQIKNLIFMIKCK